MLASLPLLAKPAHFPVLRQLRFAGKIAADNE
jgi:hypothetical protein